MIPNCSFYMHCFRWAVFLFCMVSSCSNYLAEFFQDALNMKVLLVGQSFFLSKLNYEKIYV